VPGAAPTLRAERPAERALRPEQWRPKLACHTCIDGGSETECLPSVWSAPLGRRGPGSRGGARAHWPAQPCGASRPRAQPGALQGPRTGPAARAAASLLAQKADYRHSAHVATQGTVSKTPPPRLEAVCCQWHAIVPSTNAMQDRTSSTVGVALGSLMAQRTWAE